MTGAFANHAGMIARLGTLYDDITLSVATIVHGGVVGALRQKDNNGDSE